MRERMRRREDDRDDDGPDSGAEGELESLRSAGEGFLAAADEAIDRALSANSREFLLASRQQGGQ